MKEPVGAILAAGRGTRMGSLGEWYPKPLLPIANEPLIAHHLRLFRELGIRQVYVVLGYGATQIAEALGDGTRFGLEITFVEQGPPLGSAHAVGRLAPFIDGPFLLLLGDYYFSAPGLTEMVRWARASECSIMASKREGDRRALMEACVLELDGEGRVLRITEKPKAPRSDIKGCGVYYFGPEFFDAVRQTPRTALRDEYELTVSIAQYLQFGLPLYSREIIEWDVNLTRPADVLQGNLRWLEEHHARQLVGPRAQLPADVRLERAVVGDDAILEAGAILCDSVVFEGARVPAGQVNWALVTPRELIHCKPE